MLHLGFRESQTELFLFESSQIVAMNRILTDLSPFFGVIFAWDLDTDLTAKITPYCSEGQLVDRDGSGFENDFGLFLFLPFIFHDLFLGNNLKWVSNDPSLW